MHEFAAAPVGVGRGWSAVGSIDDLVAAWEPGRYDPMRVWMWANRFPHLALRLTRYARLEVAWHRACGDTAPLSGAIPSGALDALRALASIETASAVVPTVDAWVATCQGQIWEDRNQFVLTRGGLARPLWLLGGAAETVAKMDPPSPTEVLGWFGNVEAVAEMVVRRRRRAVLVGELTEQAETAAELLNEGHLLLPLTPLMRLFSGVATGPVRMSHRATAWWLGVCASRVGRSVRRMTHLPGE